MTDPTPGAPISFKIGPSTLRAFLKALEPTCGKKGEAVRVRLARDGLSVAHIRPDHVAIERVTVSAPALEAVDGDGTFAIDTSKLITLAKVAGKNPISLEVSADRRQIVSRSGWVTYTGRLLDAGDVTDPEEPSPKPGTWADGADPGAFFRAVRDAQSVSQTARLGRTRKTVVITGTEEGQDDGSSSEVEVWTLTGSGTAEYPLDVLGPVGSAVRGAGKLALEFGRGRPLAVRFELDGAGAGVSGVYWVAPHVPDEPDPWYETARVAWWSGWAMRERSRPEPDLSAASVDTVPSVVYDTEAERVRLLNLAAEGEYRAACAEYDADMTTYGPLQEAYDESVRGFVVGWMETHKKRPAQRTIRQSVGDAPLKPSQPVLSIPNEPFDNLRGHAHRPTRETWRDETEREYERRARREMRKEARELRDHAPSGVNWGPARPKEPEPEVDVPALRAPEPYRYGPGSVNAAAERTERAIPAFEVPIVRLEAPNPPEPATVDAPEEPEVISPTPEPSESQEGPFREPIPCPSVGQMREAPPITVRAGIGADGCPTCGGSGFIDTRQHSYTCPTCGPDPPIQIDGVFA